VKPSATEVREYLDAQGVVFAQNQSDVELKIHCPQGKCHKNGDQNPSANVNLQKLVLMCHVPTCGLKGHLNKVWNELGWDPPPWIATDARQKKEPSEGKNRLPTSWK